MLKRAEFHRSPIGAVLRHHSDDPVNMGLSDKSKEIRMSFNCYAYSKSSIPAILRSVIP